MLSQRIREAITQHSEAATSRNKALGAWHLEQGASPLSPTPLHRERKVVCTVQNTSESVSDYLDKVQDTEYSECVQSVRRARGLGE